MNEPQLDIAIVGCGPVGALLANLLGQHGLSVTVFERDLDIYPLPRAVHFDGETMRIFQAAGLADRIATIARPSTKGMHFVNGAGDLLLVRRGHDGPGPQGWTSNWYVHQPDLETELRRRLAQHSSVAVHLGHEVTAVDISGAGACLTVVDRTSGKSRTIGARFVVGCDGARSLVRRAIGSERIDLGLHQPWLVVDLLVDPTSARAAALLDHTVQLCDPARPMTLVCVSERRRRWEIMLMPGDDPAAMTAPAIIWPLIARWLGPDDAAIERAAVYTFHSVIANGWRRGPLLLAGDSCHQTPPFLGQGMCAGLRDAMNLAWKLALIVKGGADPTLLDTYESERRPHVETFISLAVELGAIIQATDPAVASARDASFARGARMFDFPQPQLGPGVRDDDAAPVGTVLSQPRLADGRLLDQVTGGRFALIGERSLIDATSARTRARWHALGTVVFLDPEGALAGLVDACAAKAILIRPDGYLFGRARTSVELTRLAALLPAVAAPLH